MEGHVPRLGERRGLYMVLVGRLIEKNHLKDQSVDGKVILKLTFEK
jgi:hypothetical protein